MTVHPERREPFFAMLARNHVGPLARGKDLRYACGGGFRARGGEDTVNATIIAVGHMKEKPCRAMADEYLKRLSRYGRFRETELNDLPEPVNTSPALEEQIRRREGEAILKAIRPGDYVIALTIPGREWDSPALAAHLESLAAQGQGELVFVIGGSLGLSREVIARADEELSMSPMTFPHQLARVMLLEQLYRCCRITAGERYHK